ncbi:arylesterase [Sphingomonas sp.]
MSSRLIPYGVAIALLQALSGCSTEESATPAADRAARAPVAANVAEAGDRRLVVAFGDSLYAGYGVLAQQSFPAVLERALAAQGMVASVRNAGVSGDTTDAGRRRLAFTLDGLGEKPDLVILGLGGNDMLRGLPPEETRANLMAMLDELKRRGIPVMLTGMVAAPNMGSAYITEFNAIFPGLAREYDVPLYPFFLDGVVTSRDLMLDDGVHPNPQGIEAIVEKVAPLVAETLWRQEAAGA